MAHDSRARMRTILYDGWPLAYAPNSPGALHTLTLLEAHPPDFEPILALPALPPEWFSGRFQTRLLPASNTSRGRLSWEQRTLPAIAREMGASLVHLTSSSPGLFSQVPNIISPAGFASALGVMENDYHAAGSLPQWDSGQNKSLSERLRQSFSRSAYERVQTVLWPEDIGLLNSKLEPANLKQLPPIVHPAFLSDQEQVLDEPLVDSLLEDYLLYHGPYSLLSTQSLLKAWSWAAGPIGQNYPLALVGVDTILEQPLRQLLVEADLESSVRILPSLPPAQLALLYRRCTALFHPWPLSVWGDPVRHALASGRPVIAAESDRTASLVGPAAYLVSGNDTRGLGGALITVVVEEEMRENLSQAARVRSAGWDTALFQEKLSQVYRDLAVVNG
jgi:hypothetical protein